MTQALRLVFDDCISKHAAKKLEELAKFSRGQVEIAHLATLATLNLEGQLDDDWIPVIAASGHIAVSTDRGKKPSKGGKFPILCQRHGAIHIMMSAGVHKLNQFDKIRASPWTGKDYPRMQLLTVQELLDGKQVDMPAVRQTSQTFKKAPKAKAKPDKRQKMLGDAD